MEEEKNNKFVFHGFVKPNFTPVPDDFFDELLARLSGAELKVALYIIRRTFGFKRQSDNISLSQICKGIITREGEVLDEGTGLAESTAVVAIKRLVEKGVIVAKRNQSKERGHEPTTYGLHFAAGTIWTTFPSRGSGNGSSSAGGSFSENRRRGGPKIGEGLLRKSETQDTVLQDTENVNVKAAQKESKKTFGPEQQALLFDILEITGDPKSGAYYRQVIAELDSFTIRAALSEAKQAHLEGRTKKNPASHFTWIIEQKRKGLRSQKGERLL